MRKDKRDRECTTCEKYVRCNPEDKARGTPCCDYRRKEKKHGKGNV